MTRNMRRMLHRHRIAPLTFVVVLSTALGAYAIPAAAATPVTAASAQAWYRSVLADLSPLQSTLIGGLQAVSSWQDGRESAAKVRREIEKGLPSLESALDHVSNLAPIPGYREAKAEFVDGINLYVQSFSIISAATLVRTTPLVKQLQRAANRVRELGDVTFDEGTAEIAPLIGSTLAGNDVQAATQIPDWSNEGLAPGMPLISNWKGTQVEPTTTQSAAGWAAANTRSGAPTQASIHNAVRASRHALPAHQMQVAHELNQAEVFLSGSPDLIGYPQASALLRIALLTDAEAVLAKEASQLCRSSPASELTKVAVALASVGDSLRSEQ